MVHDDQCCSWDEDGNPEVCSGPAKEEPDCPPCGDTGYRWVDANGDPADWWATDRGPLTQVNCWDCNPTPEQHAAQLVEAERSRAEFDRLVAAGLASYDDEAPF